MVTPYYPNIPQAAHAPSLDQPLMLSNFTSLNQQFSIDHVGFTAGSNNGFHEQVTFAQNNVPGGAPTGNQSILYTAPGAISPNPPQSFFQNSQGTFPLTSNRAWGFFIPSSLPLSPPPVSINVVSVVKTGVGVYSVTLTANCVNSSNFGILLSSSFPSTASYSNISATNFIIHTYNLAGSPVDPNAVTFMVLQT